MEEKTAENFHKPVEGGLCTHRGGPRCAKLTNNTIQDNTKKECNKNRKKVTDYLRQQEKKITASN